jgi:hypothetical protein
VQVQRQQATAENSFALEILTFCTQQGTFSAFVGSARPRIAFPNLLVSFQLGHNPFSRNRFQYQSS